MMSLSPCRNLDSLFPTVTQNFALFIDDLSKIIGLDHPLPRWVHKDFLFQNGMLLKMIMYVLIFFYVICTCNLCKNENLYIPITAGNSWCMAWHEEFGQSFTSIFTGLKGTVLQQKPSVSNALTSVGSGTAQVWTAQPAKLFLRFKTGWPPPFQSKVTFRISFQYFS